MVDLNAWGESATGRGGGGGWGEAGGGGGVMFLKRIAAWRK